MFSSMGEVNFCLGHHKFLEKLLDTPLMNVNCVSRNLVAHNFNSTGKHIYHNLKETA